MIWIALTLGGCATERAVSPAAAGHLVVLELPPAPAAGSLRRVLHAKHESITPAVLAADRERINQALDTDLRAALLPKTSSQATIELTPFDDPGAAEIGRPIGGDALSRLRSAQPADSYLRVRVTDYGETPRRWEAAYIGFEVVTTLAIAGALYVHRVTRPVAVAYLGEESVEEISEGYAGFWILNRLSRPVRIEADLVDGQSGQVLWHESHTGLAPWHWRNLRHMSNDTRDGLLETSMRKAARAFAASLSKEVALKPESQLLIYRHAGPGAVPSRHTGPSG